MRSQDLLRGSFSSATHFSSTVVPFRDLTKKKATMSTDVVPQKRTRIIPKVVITSCCPLPPLPTGSTDFQAAMSELDQHRPKSSTCFQRPEDKAGQAKRRRSWHRCPALWQGPMVQYKGTAYLHLGTAIYLRRKLSSSYGAAGQTAALHTATTTSTSSFRETVLQSHEGCQLRSIPARDDREEGRFSEKCVQHQKRAWGL